VKEKGATVSTNIVSMAAELATNAVIEYHAFNIAYYDNKEQ
jgi:hypothetical protein